eukprot:7318175-Alexandrium_andersonii.AAC.1
MSASLVGSEMCIRDSPLPRAALPRVVASLQAARAMAPVRPAWVGDMLVPVSYTHLTLPTICSV